MLGALAAKTADAILAAQVDVSKSTLDRLPDSDLVLAAKRVQTAATAYAAKLAADYGVPAADLTAFADAVTAFDARKTTPRDAVVVRRVATLSLPEAITFVRGIYRNELDRLMTRFKTTQADFYAAYLGARVVVDRPGTRPAKPATLTVVPPQP